MIHSWWAKMIAVILAIVFGAGCGCAYSKTDAASMDCVYNGGMFDGKNYRGSAEPGTGRAYQGWDSEIITVPTNVRQFDQSDGLPPVVVQVRGVPLTWNPSLTFTISTVPDDKGKPASCTFLEKHLRPLGATDFNSTPSNWVNKFLLVRVADVVRDVAPRVLQDEDPTALAFNTDGARDEAAKEFGEELNKALAQQLGGNFFCSPSYQYGQGEEACGNISVVLPEPGMSAEDSALIAAPQRARTEANNDIAVAEEAARKAAAIAEQRQVEADSAVALADANEVIAEQENRVQTADAANTYAWCTYLTSLDQDCALVKAAENGDFPDFFTPDPPAIAVPPAGGG